MSLAELQAQLCKHNQQHLLRFWDELNVKERQSLAEDIKSLDVERVSSYFHRAVASNDTKKQLDDKLEPIPSCAFDSVKTSSEISRYENLGLEEVSKGRVAVVLMAGGQGTRLGVNYPKGMYNVGLPSGRTLFQLQALRIRRLEQLANERFGRSGSVVWYLMTSDATHEATLEYLETNDYFGIARDNVRAFRQSTLPCFSLDGAIILDAKHKISRAPDGNGGLYASLQHEGIIDDMKLRGINSVHTFSVDNILVKVADPVFIGYCLSREADCGAKAVSKRSADEPVGVISLVDGQYAVVEYSEISSRTAALKDEAGNLVYSAGNICNHYFRLDFLERVCNEHLEELDLHVAKKKIPYVDDEGNRFTPKTPNGIKIEKFVFDVFRFSKTFAVWEVLRDEEFSALKNADSAAIDCPSTSRNDLLSLHKKWLIKAGAEKVDGDVEICPLVSYAGENLEDVAKGKSLQGPLVLS